MFIPESSHRRIKSCHGIQKACQTNRPRQQNTHARVCARRRLADQSGKEDKVNYHQEIVRSVELDLEKIITSAAPPHPDACLHA